MKTSKNMYGVLGVAMFVGAITIFGGMKEASARANVNLNLGAEPQEVVVVPSGVVYVPDQTTDVFFYGGFWWATRDNQWYRSHDYNGTWTGVNKRSVPSQVNLAYGTPHYREVYSKQECTRVPYKQWKENADSDMPKGSHSD